jgi:cytosine/adenosine deaminase-related metal-dependent hydrolase
MAIADTLRHASGTITLRARWILPMHLPPLEDADLMIENGRIIEIRKASRQTTPTVDFGNSVLMPGLINVHAHIEYTALRGLVEDVDFFPWIRKLTQLKAQVTLRDWVSSATLGAAEMLAAGITTIGDASDAGATVAALLASGQRGIVFREVFGIEAEPESKQIVSTLTQKVRDMQGQIARAGGEDRIGVGISPHAPYTVRPDLFAALGQMAKNEGLLQTIHLAESPAEMALHQTGTGDFAEMFGRRGIQWQAPACSPIAHAQNSGAFAGRVLAVHCVHATPEDAAILKENGAVIAHCPRSNGKLAAGFAPIRMLRDAGIPIGIGTDSMVSSNSADLFEEMRHAIFVARAREQRVDALSAREALQMITSEAAQVLGLDKQIGTLEQGKKADLCVVRLDGLNLCPANEDHIEGALVYSGRASDVAFSLVDGQVCYETGHFPMLDVGRARMTTLAIRAKLAREMRDMEE